MKEFFWLHHMFKLKVPILIRSVISVFHLLNILRFAHMPSSQLRTHISTLSSKFMNFHFNNEITDWSRKNPKKNCPSDNRQIMTQFDTPANVDLFTNVVFVCISQREWRKKLFVVKSNSNLLQIRIFETQRRNKREV